MKVLYVENGWKQKLDYFGDKILQNWNHEQWFFVTIEKLTILWGQNRNLQCLKYAKNSYQYLTSSKLIRSPFNFGQNEHLERNVYIMDTV